MVVFFLTIFEVIIALVILSLSLPKNINPDLIVYDCFPVVYAILISIRYKYYPSGRILVLNCNRVELIINKELFKRNGLRCSKRFTPV